MVNSFRRDWMSSLVPAAAQFGLISGTDAIGKDSCTTRRDMTADGHGVTAHDLRKGAVTFSEPIGKSILKAEGALHLRRRQGAVVEIMVDAPRGRFESKSFSTQCDGEPAPRTVRMMFAAIRRTAFLTSRLASCSSRRRRASASDSESGVSFGMAENPRV